MPLVDALSLKSLELGLEENMLVGWPMLT